MALNATAYRAIATALAAQARADAGGADAEPRALAA
jgi:hypothetical protein